MAGMRKRKYDVRVIYRTTPEAVTMLDAICENHTRSRGEMIQHLIKQEFAEMKKQEKADG